MSNVIEVNADSWDAEVTASTVPVIVDFWAPWCGPCRIVAPEIEKLAQRAGGSAKFVKVNIDDNQALAVAHGVMSIPTIARFDGGAVTAQVVGARGADALERELRIGA